jgi:cob(I)alamin adenosyltransferase
VIITQLEHSERKAFLQKVQSDLLTIGAYLAGWKEADLGMLGARVTEMELEIDVMGKELPELRNFILPGGILVAAQTQVCRSVCRRAERLVVAVSKKQRIDAAILQYLNRLSDLFFQLARFINYKAQVSDEVWLGIPRK